MKRKDRDEGGFCRVKKSDMPVGEELKSTGIITIKKHLKKNQ